MTRIWMRAGVAAAATILAGCASDQASVERGGVPGGAYACNASPGVTLVVSNDGAYELRWRDTQDRRSTGWIEASGDQLRPTSGPLQGSIGQRTANGITFSGGESVMCGAFTAVP